MRIRQVRPEFWTDETMAALPPAVRLFYIGLWNVADDAGFMEWRPSRIGAVLFPYESSKRRERDIAGWADRLVDAGRLRRYDCGCAEIPTLSKHQRVTGKLSYTAREAHVKHLLLTDKHPSLSGSPVTERNVTVGNVAPAGADVLSQRDEEDRREMAVRKSLRSVS